METLFDSVIGQHGKLPSDIRAAVCCDAYYLLNSRMATPIAAMWAGEEPQQAAMIRAPSLQQPRLRRGASHRVRTPQADGRRMLLNRLGDYPEIGV